MKTITYWLICSLYKTGLCICFSDSSCHNRSLAVLLIQDDSHFFVRLHCKYLPSFWEKSCLRQWPRSFLSHPWREVKYLLKLAEVDWSVYWPRAPAKKKFCVGWSNFYPCVTFLQEGERKLSPWSICWCEALFISLKRRSYPWHVC